MIALPAGSMSEDQSSRANAFQDRSKVPQSSVGSLPEPPDTNALVIPMRIEVEVRFHPLAAIEYLGISQQRVRSAGAVGTRLGLMLRRGEGGRVEGVWLPTVDPASVQVDVLLPCASGGQGSSAAGCDKSSAWSWAAMGVVLVSIAVSVSVRAVCYKKNGTRDEADKEWAHQSRLLSDDPLIEEARGIVHQPLCAQVTGIADFDATHANSRSTVAESRSPKLCCRSTSGDWASPVRPTAMIQTQQRFQGGDDSMWHARSGSDLIESLFSDASALQDSTSDASDQPSTGPQVGGGTSQSRSGPECRLADIASFPAVNGSNLSDGTPYEPSGSMPSTTATRHQTHCRGSSLMTCLAIRYYLIACLSCWAVRPAKLPLLMIAAGASLQVEMASCSLILIATEVCTLGMRCVSLWLSDDLIGSLLKTTTRRTHLIATLVPMSGIQHLQMR